MYIVHILYRYNITIFMSLQTVQNLTVTLLLPFAAFTICCVIIKVMVFMTIGNVICNHNR